LSQNDRRGSQAARPATRCHLNLACGDIHDELGELRWIARALGVLRHGGVAKPPQRVHSNSVDAADEAARHLSAIKWL